MKQFTFQARLTLLYLLPILYIKFFHYLNLSLSIAYMNFSDSDVTAYKLFSHQRVRGLPKIAGSLARLYPFAF